MIAELLFLLFVAIAAGTAVFLALWGLWLGASRFWDWYDGRRNKGERV